jgi:hypothetical protein
VRWLRASAFGLLINCCNTTLSPCCVDTPNVECDAQLAAAAACNTKNGNWYANAPDGGALCEFGDGGAGPVSLP